MFTKGGSLNSQHFEEDKEDLTTSERLADVTIEDDYVFVADRHRSNAEVRPDSFIIQEAEEEDTSDDDEEEKINMDENPYLNDGAAKSSDDEYNIDFEMADKIHATMMQMRADISSSNDEGHHQSTEDKSDSNQNPAQQD